ncbi:MAG: 50S ribosomal protein L35 [Candidatus Gracilibacteria bacterium]|nr:50S ribosomal protein L35 [Candidatus Gracilibacteria bacterium]
MKKRVKIRKSGKLEFAKAGKKHLLANKSKRAKKSSPCGVAVPESHEKQIRRMLAGRVY